MGGDATTAETATSESNTAGVNINIRCSNGSKFSVQISLDSLVRSFKDVVARNCDIPADQQRLIYKGRILKDDQTLQSYGILLILLLFLYFPFVLTFIFLQQILDPGFLPVKYVYCVFLYWSADFLLFNLP